MWDERHVSDEVVDPLTPERLVKGSNGGKAATNQMFPYLLCLMVQSF